MMRHRSEGQLSAAVFAFAAFGAVLGCKGEEQAPGGIAGAGGAMAAAGAAGSGAGEHAAAGVAAGGAGDDPAAPRNGATVVLDAPALVTDNAIVFEDEVAPAPVDETMPEQVVAGPGPTWTKEEYCTARVEGERVWCDYLIDCCTIDDRASLLFIPPACANGAPTESDCLLELTELEAAGIVFDGTWAAACLDFDEGHLAWPPDECAGVGLHDTFYNRRTVPSRYQVEACRRMTRGTKGPGEGCQYRSECQVGLACISAPLSSTNNYECQRPRRATEICDTTADCERGLFCVSDGLTNTCGPLHAATEPCGDAFDCVNGLQCVNGSCAEPRYLNDPCTLGEQCEVSLACDTTASQCVLAEALICDGI